MHRPDGMHLPRPSACEPPTCLSTSQLTLGMFKFTRKKMKSGVFSGTKLTLGDLGKTEWTIVSFVLTRKPPRPLPESCRRRRDQLEAKAMTNHLHRSPWESS